MPEKQGFSVENFNLTGPEEGWAAQVNECVEALADGFQLSEDGFVAYQSGRALMEAVLANKHSKEAVIVCLTKLVMANVFDELAENSKVIAAQKKRIANLESTVVKLKASARR